MAVDLVAVTLKALLMVIRKAQVNFSVLGTVGNVSVCPM